VWPFLVVSAHVPVASVAELVAFAKQHPNKLTYASLGIGSSFHLLGESLKRFTGTELRHVPYSQGGTVMVATDVVAGRVDTTFISYTNLQPHLAGGKLRVLAYTGEKRFRQLPDVPALTEALPGLPVAPQFFALLGPAALPPALASRLAGETRKALQDADIAAKLEGLGMVPVGSTPEALAAVIQRGIDISGDLVRSLGIPPR
jgi:tripartite-type tricarboxylate transporter receptor subunit TctC